MRGKPLKSRPQQLRTNATEAERRIWYFFRNRQFEKFKFRRQHPIGVYIVDFVCLEQKLIVELDGGQHVEQAQYDARRTNALIEKGFRVLRYWNNDVLNNTNAVLETILAELNACPSLAVRAPAGKPEPFDERDARVAKSSSHPSPSPRSGERG